MTLTVGTDPECFLKEGENIVAAIGRIGGDKENPLAVPGGGALQEDNVLGEFNVPPATTPEELIDSIHYVTEQLKGFTGCDVDWRSSYHFSQDYLVDLGDKALTFGCDPDFNCWTQEVNESPSPFTTLRTAGGHVHVGGTGYKPETIAQLCDVFLGVPSVLMDDDVERREMYGQAGAYRPKSYGAEYRTLSNFWLRQEDKIRWVFKNVKEAMSRPEILNNVDGSEVQRIINESDKAMARDFCEHYGVAMG